MTVLDLPDVNILSADPSVRSANIRDVQEDGVSAAVSAESGLCRRYRDDPWMAVCLTVEMCR
jgi:hypothetical protein